MLAVKMHGRQGETAGKHGLLSTPFSVLMMKIAGSCEDRTLRPENNARAVMDVT
jgi:hypothetical protein